MTGGIGNTLAPLILGVVADVFGLVTVFYASSVSVAVGLVGICWIWFRTPAPTTVLVRSETPCYTREGVP
jgi:hypothetical protein